MSIKGTAAKFTVAATLLVTLGAPPGAGAAGKAPSPAKVTAQILTEAAAVKAQLATLVSELGALQSKAEALEGRQPSAASFLGTQAGGALTGAYPVPTLKPNVVDGANVVDGSLTGSDFGPGTIGPGQLAGPGLGSAALGSGAIVRADLAPNSVGAPQLGSMEIVNSEATENFLVAPGEVVRRAAKCPQGDLLIGGGTEWVPTVGNLDVDRTGPGDSGTNAWVATGRNSTAATLASFNAIALCLKVSQ